ncbi:MAG: HAMP domain-containing histidine kinase [Halioglobus sp.]|nr:HAMP domain-containing histidine kinase [Halioglobus sp.]
MDYRPDLIATGVLGGSAGQKTQGGGPGADLRFVAAALQSQQFPVWLNMSFWRPRSVLQLVLVGFFTALAPLCLAILFTVQTLEELAGKERAVTRQIVAVTRLGGEIQTELLELERHARQYLTLFDPELARLAENERTQLLRQLRELGGRVGAPGPELALLQSLQRLDMSLLNARQPGPATTVLAGAFENAFATISEQRRALRPWLQSWVEQLLHNNADQAEAVINAMFVQLSFLVFATLALLLLFAYWINKPVQQLTQEIHRLGTSGLGHTIRISGPQEVAALGQKLDWLRQRLHETELQKQQFQRHISHELKTPLASLREGTDLLAEQVTGHLSQQQQAVVDIVRENAIELQRMIENLVDYNPLSRREPVFERIVLAPLWQEILASYRITIDQKHIAVTLRGAVDDWVADRHKLKTTLDNLLSNAVNYAPEDGRVDIVWQREGANLVIEVANSGEPIPKADRERVFEPFFQSTATRTGPIKGSGVGLSVARECIEIQGGELSLVAHSELPVCFRLLCPAR